MSSKLKYYKTKRSNRVRKLRLRRSKCSVKNVYEIILSESNRHIKLVMFDKLKQQVLFGSSSEKFMKGMREKDSSVKKMDCSKAVGLDMKKKCEDLKIDTKDVFINIGEKKYIGNAKSCVDSFYGRV